jgi:hypothetical protein
MSIQVSTVVAPPDLISTTSLIGPAGPVGPAGGVMPLGGTAVPPAKLFYYNVKDYGAVGNGTTNDVAAVQAAINAAVAAGGGIVYFPVGSYLCSSPLNIGGNSVTLAGVGGLGQYSITPASSLVYSGSGTGAFINGKSRRSLAFNALGLFYNNSGFTGPVVDISGPGATRNSFTQVLIGSTPAALLTTALGVTVDGAYNINFYDTGFVGLANGVQGQLGSGNRFANGVTFTGCYGAGISGWHMLGAGYGWSWRGYVAEPTAAAVPNFLLVDSTVVAPSCALFACHLDDATAAGAWISMASGNLTVIGGYFRIDGGGAVIRATGALSGLTLQGAIVGATPGSGAIGVDGGGFTHAGVRIGANTFAGVDNPVVNMPAGIGMIDTGSGLSLPASVSGTSLTMSSQTKAPAIVVGSTGGPNTLTAAQTLTTNSAGGFGNNANATLAPTTAQFLGGAYSLGLTSIAAGGLSIINSGANRFTAQPNTQYTVLASFRAASTAQSCRMDFFWYNSSGTQVGSTVTGTAVTDSSTGWTQAVQTMVSPPGTASLSVVIRVLSTAALGEVHYVTNLSLATGTSQNWLAAGTTVLASNVQSGNGPPGYTGQQGWLYIRLDGHAAGANLYKWDAGSWNGIA